MAPSELFAQLLPLAGVYGPFSITPFHRGGEDGPSLLQLGTGSGYIYITIHGTITNGTEAQVMRFLQLITK